MPARRPTRPAALLLILAASALATAPARAEDAVSALEGTWYVLVHYRDSATANPEAERWLDLVWDFESSGSRLRWTEYPIVVFDDPAGRWEQRGGHTARTLRAWEPSEAQWQAVAEGPRVNERGSISKTLRGSDREGWTTGRRRATQSSRVIGYEKSWQIEGLPEGPVFTQDDILGSATTEHAEGRTRFAVTEVFDDSAMSGTFERDDSRTGTFRMVRSGSASEAGEDAPSPGARRLLATIEILQTRIREEGPPPPRDEYSTFPYRGASLADVLAGLRAQPERDANVIVQKLAIFRVDEEPWGEIAEAQVREGDFDAEGDFAVLAARYCTATAGLVRSEWRSVDWFLLPRNRLDAYEFYAFPSRCTQVPLVFPARGDRIETEHALTDYLAKSFPEGNVHRTTYYMRGLLYLAAGRSDDARKMLEAGDAAFEPTAKDWRHDAEGPESSLRFVRETDEELMRSALVRQLQLHAEQTRRSE